MKVIGEISWKIKGVVLRKVSSQVSYHSSILWHFRTKLLVRWCKMTKHHNCPFKNLALSVLNSGSLKTWFTLTICWGWQKLPKHEPKLNLKTLGSQKPTDAQRSEKSKSKVNRSHNQHMPKEAKNKKSTKTNEDQKKSECNKQKINSR